MRPPAGFVSSRALACAVWLVVVGAPGLLAWKHGASGSRTYSHLEFSTLTGIFLQDDVSTRPEDFDYVRALAASSDA